MPKLKPSNAVNILKPDKLRLGYGETGTCTVTGPHVTGGKDELDSLPVEINIPAGTGPDGAPRPASRMEGNFPLNATRKNLLMGLWGDDTDYWEKGSYQWVVVPQNNPQTKQQVPAWLINASSVQPKGVRPKDQTPIQAQSLDLISLQGLQRGHSSSPQGLRGGHSTSLQGLRGGHSTSLQGLQRGHSSSLQGLRRGHSSSRQGLQRGHSSSRQGLRRGHSSSRQE